MTWHRRPRPIEEFRQHTTSVHKVIEEAHLLQRNDVVDIQIAGIREGYAVVRGRPFTGGGFARSVDYDTAK